MDQYLTEYIKSAAALNPTVENQLLGWLAEARDRGLEDIGSIPDLAEVSLAPPPSSILDDDSGSFVRRVLAASERLSSPVNTSDMDILMSNPGAGGRLLRPETATIKSKTRSASESRAGKLKRDFLLGTRAFDNEKPQADDFPHSTWRVSRAGKLQQESMNRFGEGSIEQPSSNNDQDMSTPVVRSDIRFEEQIFEPAAHEDERPSSSLPTEKNKIKALELRSRSREKFNQVRSRS